MLNRTHVEAAVQPVTPLAHRFRKRAGRGTPRGRSSRWQNKKPSALFSSDGLQRLGTRKTVPENVVSFCGGGERTTHMQMHMRSVKRLVSECFPAGLIHR